MTREEAVKWCLRKGYMFIELYDGEIVYTVHGELKRGRACDNESTVGRICGSNTTTH